MSNFENNGSGKGANAFKWTAQFAKSLTHQSTTEVGATDDLLSRPQILKHLGLSIKDFASKEDAWKYVEKEVERNKLEFEHEGKVIMG